MMNHIPHNEVTMSMQSENTDTKQQIAQQPGTQGPGQQGGAAGGSEQSDENANQQGELPPSQTDDDQYDQGTVKRAP